MKKFFEKAKLEIKFRKAGDGHTVSESKPDQPSTSQQQTSASRTLPAASAQRAGQAALERFTQKEKVASKKPQSANTTWKHSIPSSQGEQTSAGGSTAIDYKQLQAEAYKEIEGKELVNRQNSLPSQSENTQSLKQQEEQEHPLLSVEGVYLKCPLCAGSFPHKDKNRHLTECLEIKYTEDAPVAAATMIQTLNKDKDKVKACIDILCRYLDNVCKNPGEEKFRKIKQSNKIFQDRVIPIKGAIEFLAACGFENISLAVEDHHEQFYILPEDKSKDTEKLDLYKGILLSIEPLKLAMDHCGRVFQPSTQAMKFELPEEFFSLSSDEIKREYQTKMEDIEKSSQLRTKAMREADKRPTKSYRFTLLRIRFPDGIVLQGTFYAREKLQDLIGFVRESLKSDWLPFVLSDPTGQLTKEESTLSDLGLVPAAVVNFAWDAGVMADIAAASGSVQQGDYLKDELMTQIQNMQIL